MKHLNKQDLLSMAPSIFTSSASNKASEKYKHINTEKILDLFESKGFYPVRAHQSRSKDINNKPYVKHIIRLRHESFFNDYASTEIPEIVLLNSHNTQNSLRLMLGIFRIACCNGLIVQDASYSDHRILHMGYTEQKVLDAIQDIHLTASKMQSKIDSYKNTILVQSEQKQLAAKALQLKYGDDAKGFDLHDLLNPRRIDDYSSDLWTTFNTIQENLINAKQVYFRPIVDDQGNVRYKRATTRPIKGIDRNIEINQKLWETMLNIYNQKTSIYFQKPSQAQGLIL